MHELRSSFRDGEGVQPRQVIATKKNRREDDPRVASLGAIAVKREEARVTNMRREERRRDAIESATLFFRRRKHCVPVVNVSASGVMIEADLEARIGERLEMQFDECERTPCVVRWARDGRIGLEFLAETAILARAAVKAVIYEAHNPAQTDARKAPLTRYFRQREQRQGLVLSGYLYWSFEALTVRLRNISSTGALLTCDRDIPVGAQVRLHLAEAGTLPGEVRWSRNGQLGIHFDQRFNMRLLAEMSSVELTDKQSGRREFRPAVGAPASVSYRIGARNPYDGRIE